MLWRQQAYEMHDVTGFKVDICFFQIIYVLIVMKAEFSLCELKKKKKNPELRKLKIEAN